MNSETISDLFNSTFEKKYRVRLVGGATEPIYLPPTNKKTGVIFFREDFVSSALHEVAHWCLAGRDRRKMVDFGYEYISPPRDEIAQKIFLQAETRVQGLERLFSEVSGVSFLASLDNLDCDEVTTKKMPKLVLEFETALETESQNWKLKIDRNPSLRAAIFYDSLHEIHTGSSSGFG